MNLSEFKKEFDLLLLESLNKYIEESKEITTNERLKEIFDHIIILAAKGKRIRPFIIAVGYQENKGSWKDIKDVLVAIELIHLMALVEDDIMDEQELRHGTEAIHTFSKKTYKEPINEHQAILIADLLFNWAYNSFFSFPQSKESLNIWKKLINEVVIGQMIDLDNRNQKDPLEKNILECMLLKTARYTCTRPLELGLILSDKKPSDWVYVYGDNLGTCFQITDDLIDIMSEDEDLGKHGFTDIVEGQPTLINAKIKNQNDLLLTKEFNEIFGSKNRNLITNEFKQRIRTNGLVGELRNEVFEKLEKAKISIENEDIKDNTKKILLDLILLIEKRTS